MTRRKARSAFTLIGISIGIATIITLSALMNGMTSGMEGIIRSGEADFIITQEGISDLTFSRLSEDTVDDIKALSGVRNAAGVTFTMYPVGNNPYLFVWGVHQEDLSTIGMTLVEGSEYSQNDELLIGKATQKELNRTVGENITVAEAEFKITGIYETGQFYQDKGVTMPLEKLQEMTKQEGNIMMIYVELEDEAKTEETCKLVEQQFPELITIKSASELGKVDQGLEILDAGSLAISFLAVLIGGIGVTNTIMMSIHERTREIGVLRALGWKRRRVLGMILGESIFLCIFSMLIGTLFGIMGVQLLMLYPAVGSLLTPIYTLGTFLRAFAVALAVGLLGGIYPAYRASKLSPSEALRYE